MTLSIRNHGETRLKPATLLRENFPKRESCAARSNYFSHFSNGKGSGNRKWKQSGLSIARTQREEHVSTIRFGWKPHRVPRKQKPSTRYNNPGESTPHQTETST